MEEIVAQMMGNEAKETKFEYVPREYDCNAEDLLTVKHLKINDKIDDINFSIKPGLKKIAKSLCNNRSNPEFCLWVQMLDCLCHQMCTGMIQCF